MFFFLYELQARSREWFTRTANNIIITHAPKLIVCLYHWGAEGSHSHSA